MTTLDFTTTSEVVASEDKPRSNMATVLAVGVGVAATAFFVNPPSPLLAASYLLTNLRRDERAW